MQRNIRMMRQRRKNLHASSTKGFTLLEMLVVLVIIGLVASLVGPQLLGRVDKSKVTTADVQTRMLKGALQTVKLDLGRFPTKEEGLSLLITPPNNQKAQLAWSGPYLSEDIPLDPWGNPYQYKPENSNNIILYSFGADGKDGGEGINADVGFISKKKP